MKNTLFIIIAIILLTSCSKEYEPRTVTYLITGLSMPYQMAYINESGETISKTITPVNDKEIWSYTFNGHQGDVVYLYALYKDLLVDPQKFKFRILINGKTYKESYGYDLNQGDTLFRVKRSGVVPF
jgi:hypothetical protein